MARYFENVNNLEELRKQYKKLLKKFHPDNGGSEEAVKEINTEYERLFKALSSKKEEGDKNYSNNKKYDYKADLKLREVLNKIIMLDVEIEICGSWIWVSGNTYGHKDQLKAAGLRYSGSKKKWYYGEYSSKRRTSIPMEKIRDLYGSEKVQNEKIICIGA